MRLRKYQSEATAQILENVAKGVMTNLIVLATGCGKTVVFSHVANDRKEHGRVMVMAHRAELVYQAARKLETITGVMPAIEMGDSRSDEWNAYGKPPIVVASVQTLSAKGGKRCKRFDPHEFSVLVIDEAHHGPADTWASVVAHFRQNPDCLILGVTATAMRGDDRNLGSLFETCAYEYNLVNAIEDGYLVPIFPRTVVIDGLDLSSVRTTAGDLNQGDMETCVMLEKPLHGIANAIMEVTTGIAPGSLARLKDSDDIRAEFDRLRAGRRPLRTLVFATSVLHAQRLAEICERWLLGCADYIDGTMSAELRKEKLRAYERGDFRILVNCMVATEGFDAPFIECVAIARFTKSQTLYCQMTGRGTRPAENIAHQLGDAESADARRAMIAESEKPKCMILDFAGNHGRHKLVTAVDLVAAEGTAPEVVELAKKICVDGEKSAQEGLFEAREEIELRKRQSEEKKRLREIEEQKKRDAAARRRANLIKAQEYRIFEHGEQIQRRIKSNRSMEKQINMLMKAKWPEAVVARMSDAQIKQACGEQRRRWANNLCTYKQAKFLQQHNYTKQQLHDMPMAQASKIIDGIMGRRKAVG